MAQYERSQQGLGDGETSERAMAARSNVPSVIQYQVSNGHRGGKSKA